MINWSQKRPQRAILSNSDQYHDRELSTITNSIQITKEVVPPTSPKKDTQWSLDQNRHTRPLRLCKRQPLSKNNHLRSKESEEDLSRWIQIRGWSLTVWVCVQTKTANSIFKIMTIQCKQVSNLQHKAISSCKLLCEAKKEDFNSIRKLSGNLWNKFQGPILLEPKRCPILIAKASIHSAMRKPWQLLLVSNLKRKREV